MHNNARSSAILSRLIGTASSKAVDRIAGLPAEIALMFSFWSLKAASTDSVRAVTWARLPAGDIVRLYFLPLPCHLPEKLIAPAAL